MTPAARVQAAIECLGLIADAARDSGAAADTIIARYFTYRRYAGSKDRRAVRSLIYDVVRSVGDRPASGRGALIGHARARAPELLALFGGDGYAPAALDRAEVESMVTPVSHWVAEQLGARFGNDTPRQVSALLERAPLDLRVNRLRTTVDAAMTEIEGAEVLRLAPFGIRTTAPLIVESHPAFRAGHIEVQDEGSQIASAVTGALAGMIVVDLCAGAGGKTLALAADMANDGTLYATDTDRGRLDRMGPRLERAGVSIVERRLLDPGREWDRLNDLAGRCDIVLVDAPCSGTGTWRRNPEGRWRLSASRLARLEQEQARLLDLGRRLVKSGGVLAYAVCSLLPTEGENQMAQFLRRNVQWRRGNFRNPATGLAVNEMVLTPGDQGCDGFYIAQATLL